MIVRPAAPADGAAITRIYNAGIDDRIATFETRHRNEEDVLAWFDDTHPIVVVEDGGQVLGFAATFSYRPRECYAGIAEFSVYVTRKARGRGVGTLALKGLIEAAQEAGFWKLVSRVFPQNVASLKTVKKLGFREVGVYEKHGKLDGEWRDVVIVELLIEGNLK